ATTSLRRINKKGSEPTSRPSGCCAAIALNAASSSGGVLALYILSSSPLARAAAWASLISGTASGLSGLASMATLLAVGTSSRSPSILFCPTGAVISVIPVALPLGWLRLSTSPAAIGSKPTTNTIGIVVAALAANAAGGA